MTLDVQPVNPWTWQDQFGFSQAYLVSGVTKVLYCAGQASMDANGRPVHAGDMPAQLSQAFDNLEAVLQKAGLSLKNVVRLNYYVTDIPAYFQAVASVADRLARAGCQPPGTLLGVAALAFPELMVEIEATAVV
jgi:enamine deaminase RidA (YjgF/YER057c/UK114 family)